MILEHVAIPAFSGQQQPHPGRPLVQRVYRGAEVQEVLVSERVLSGSFTLAHEWRWKDGILRPTPCNSGCEVCMHEFELQQLAEEA